MTVQQQTQELDKAQEMAAHFSNSEKPVKANSFIEQPIKKVQSRFGEIEINLEKAINFPHGILGLPTQLNFCLADFPREGFEQFKLLQSVEDPNLCFITLPSGFENKIISESDLNDACAVFEIKPESLLVLFVVTTHHGLDKQIKISINAKAPILVNAETFTACQYVLNGKDYEIRHMIS